MWWCTASILETWIWVCPKILNAPKPAIFQRIMLEPLSLNLKNIFHEQLVFSLLALDFPLIRNHSSPKTCCHLRTHLHIHHHATRGDVETSSPVPPALPAAHLQPYPAEISTRASHFYLAPKGPNDLPMARWISNPTDICRWYLDILSHLALLWMWGFRWLNCRSL